MAKYNKVIAAFLASVLGVGLAAIIPGINGAWDTILTATLAVVATYFAPANDSAESHE